MGYYAADYQPHGDKSNARAPQRGFGRRLMSFTRKRTLSCASAQARPSIAFVHDLAGRRKRLMLDRSLQIEFDSYRKTLSTADRLAFDECIARLLSQHGIDYVRGYVAALKERGSR